MNSLLPLNEKQELHLLDDYFGSRIDNLNNLNLEVHPLFTEEKYLKLLSYILEIDITGLSQNEARELLSLFVELKKYAGTVYILKKIIRFYQMIYYTFHMFYKKQLLKIIVFQNLIN